MANIRNVKSKKKGKFNKAGGKHSSQFNKGAVNKNKVLENTLNKCRKDQVFFVKKKKGGLKFIFSRRVVKRAIRYKCFANKNKLHIHSIRKDMEGSRIMNIDKVKCSMLEITNHTALCHAAQEMALANEAAICFNSETKHGLYSVISASCNGCKKTFTVESCGDFGNSDITRKDLNVRAVWGSMVTGGGCSSMNEMLGTMGVPGMSDKTYMSIEEEIGKLWKGVLEEEMIKAGNEERQLAIENGDFFQGVPAITIICDGGWSKRTHKHSYNAMGGVGVIFGARTKKLLHIGIKNKLCYICSSANSKNVQPNAHVCFKNWNESSQSMESAIILEGFLECEEKYGLRYMNMIGDGDSSVYANITRNVPVWGPYVKKIECANHATKCLRSNIEKLLVDKPHYKGKGQLTKVNVVRITTGVRCAIKMRSAENDRTLAIKKLKQDIKNTGRHVLGLHNMCSTDFCKYTDSDQNTPDTDKDLDNEDNDDVIVDQCDYWQDNNDLNEVQELVLRKGGKKTTSVNSDLLKDIFFLLNRLSDKADRLIGNFTSNLAESWMHIRCKFDGGKFSNKCFKGSFYTRCYGGALRSLMGPAWAPQVYNQITGTRPDNVFVDTYRKRVKKYNNSIKASKNSANKSKKMKRKLQSVKINNSKKAKLDYGTGVLIDTEDICASDIEAKQKIYFNENIKVSSEKIKEIEIETKDQSSSKQWHEERQKRITSSVFGEVMSRSKNNNSPALVKRLLYTKFNGNQYTRKGLKEEENARLEYLNKNNQNLNIQVPGLVISKDFPYLATSSDGIVHSEKGPEGLVEIKTLLQTKPYMIREAVLKDKTFCLKIQNEQIALKHNHKYYYQIQGQLNILNLPWCDLIVRRTNPYDIYIERIQKDENLWINTMIPKLNAFYITHILPELAVPRHGTVSGIRKPPIPWYDDLSTKTQLNEETTSTCRKKKSQCNPSLCKKERHHDVPSRPAPTRTAAQSTKTATVTKPLIDIPTVTAQLLPDVPQQPCTSSSNHNRPAPTRTASQSTKTATVTKPLIDIPTVTAQLLPDVPQQPCTSSSNHNRPAPTRTASQSTKTATVTKPLIDIPTVTAQLLPDVPQQPCTSSSNHNRPAPTRTASQSTKTATVTKPLIDIPTVTAQLLPDVPQQPCTSSSNHNSSQRRKTVKFVGRRILHKWEEDNGKESWYTGTVLSVIKGIDGRVNATYEVFYDKDEETYDIESLHIDYNEGNLKFNDL